MFVVFQLLKRVYGNLLVAPEDGKPNGCCFNLCYSYCKNFGLMVCCCSSLKGTTFRCSLTWMHFHPTKRRWSTRLAFSRETALLLSSRSTSSSRRRVVRERKGLLSITGMTSLCKLLKLSSIGLQLTTNLVIICLINWIKVQNFILHVIDKTYYQCGIFRPQGKCRMHWMHIISFMQNNLNCYYINSNIYLNTFSHIFSHYKYLHSLKEARITK